MREAERNLKAAIELSGLGFNGPNPLESNSKATQYGYDPSPYRNKPMPVSEIRKFLWSGMGISMGERLVAADWDGPGALEIREKMIEAGMLPTTLSAKTPNGGMHDIFKSPYPMTFKTLWESEEKSLRPSGEYKHDRIELVAGNSQIVVSPTVIDGRSYAWLVEPRHVDSGQINDLPLAFKEAYEALMKGKTVGSLDIFVHGGNPAPNGWSLQDRKDKQDEWYEDRTGLVRGGARNTTAHRHFLNSLQMGRDPEDLKGQAQRYRVLKIEPSIGTRRDFSESEMGQVCQGAISTFYKHGITKTESFIQDIISNLQLKKLKRYGPSVTTMNKVLEAFMGPNGCVRKRGIVKGNSVQMTISERSLSVDCKSQPKTVRRCLEDFQEQGFLEIVDNGRGKPKTYVFTTPSPCDKTTSPSTRGISSNSGIYPRVIGGVILSHPLHVPIRWGTHGGGVNSIDLKIVNAAFEFDAFMVGDIHKLTGITKRTIQRRMDRLVENRLLEKAGENLYRVHDGIFEYLPELLEGGKERVKALMGKYHGEMLASRYADDESEEGGLSGRDLLVMELASKRVESPCPIRQFFSTMSDVKEDLRTIFEGKQSGPPSEFPPLEVDGWEEIISRDVEAIDDKETKRREMEYA